MDKFVVRMPRQSPSSSPRKNGISNYRQSTLLSLKGVVIIEDIERAKIVLERSDTKAELKIDTLRHLRMKNPAKEILKKTGIGKTVYKLSKSEDKDIAEEAKKVHKLWKKHLESTVGRPMLEVKCDLKTQNFRKSARQMILDGLKRGSGGEILGGSTQSHSLASGDKEKSEVCGKGNKNEGEIEVIAECSGKEKDKDERKTEKEEKDKSKKKKSKDREREKDNKHESDRTKVIDESVEKKESEEKGKQEKERKHKRDRSEHREKDRKSRKENESTEVSEERDKKREEEEGKRKSEKRESDHKSKRERSGDHKKHKKSKREKDSCEVNGESLDKGDREKDKRKSEKDHRHELETSSEGSKKDKRDKDESVEVLSENVRRDSKRKSEKEAYRDSKKRKSEATEKEDENEKDSDSVEVLAEYIEREVYQNTKRMINKSYKRTIRKIVFCLRHQTETRVAVTSSSLSVKQLVKDNLHVSTV